MINSKYIIILTLLIINPGCSFRENIVSERYKTQARLSGKSEFISLHKNFIVGDFAILNDSYMFHYETIIIKIENNLVYLKETFYHEDRSCVGSAMKSLKFPYTKVKSRFYKEIVSDLNGKVINAYIVNEENNNKEELFSENHVVGIGEDNKNIYSIKTDAGEFKCHLRYRIIRIKNTDYYFIIWLSDEVKFYIVKVIAVSKKDFEKFKLLTPEEKADYNAETCLVLCEQGNR